MTAVLLLAGETPGSLRAASGVSPCAGTQNGESIRERLLAEDPNLDPGLGGPRWSRRVAKSPRFYIEGGPLRDRASESAIFGAIAVKTRSQTRGFLGIRVIFGPLAGQTRRFLGILGIFGPIFGAKSEVFSGFWPFSDHFRSKIRGFLGI